MRRGPAARLALAAIRGYQRWISPYKGFRCALRAHTGGDSCSSYGYLVIGRFGLRRGLGLLDRRLELCGHVHRRFAPARPASPVRNPWRHREQGLCDLSCDSPGCDLPDLPCHGHAGDCVFGDCLGFTNCGCDIGDCGRSKRQQRDSVHLDALAQRIAERKRQRPS